MGSMITLGIERMEIDWGKNNSYTDHSALFQLSDIKEIPYYYVESGNPIVEMKEGCAKKLSDVKQRLDMLGYNLLNLPKLYNDFFEEYTSHYEEITIETISYDVFYKAIDAIDLNKVNNLQDSSGYVDFQEGSNGYDFGEYARICILNDPEILEGLSIRDKRSVSYFIENIDPYITIRILAENPINQSLELQWRYIDVVEGGWVKREDILCGCSEENKVLIVTEGSSDSFILKKTITSLYPIVSDFFEFIDMEEGYPFTGTGNLFNFCKGLAKINIRNNIIILFDNDTSGNEKYELAQKIDKPSTMMICKLPYYKEFASFDIKGPEGYGKANINGKAVAIECFLDFMNRKPYIQWTSYNNILKQYQGEIYPKDDLVREFKKVDLKAGVYNNVKLKYLVDYLIREWVKFRY